MEDVVIQNIQVAEGSLLVYICSMKFTDALKRLGNDIYILLCTEYIIFHCVHFLRLNLSPPPPAAQSTVYKVWAACYGEEQTTLER